MRKAAIFLNQCLPLSEVFVYHQAAALQKYKPVLVACKKVSPSVQTGMTEIILNRTNSLTGKIKEALFKATGFSPFMNKAVRDCDIIHAHFGPTGWLASAPASHEKKPLIVTLHGFDVLKNDISIKTDGMLQAVYAKNVKTLGQRAAVFVCNSEYLKKRAIQFGFPAEKCQVIYLGIPLPEVPRIVKTKQAGEPFRLFAAGRLVPFKGHTKLIEAVSILQQDGYNVRLDIAGGGPLRDELEAQAKSSIANYTFHGAQPHERMMELMRESDIFCHTSMHMKNGQTEALGLVVLEAQWNGLPVIAFASGGVPEAMEDKVTGLLCEEGDAQAFADHIKTLIDNPELRKRMADAAPAFVKSRFDNSQQNDKLEALYDSVIAKGIHV